MFNFADLKAMWSFYKPAVEKTVRSYVPVALRGNDMVEKAVAVGVVLIVAAVVVGAVALPIYYNTNTTGWDTTTKTVWNVLPVLGIVAILFIFIALMRHKGVE